MSENWLWHAFLLHAKICYRYITHHIIFVKKQVTTLYAIMQVQKTETK